MKIKAGIITKIEQQSKGRSRVNVYIDGDYAFSLSETVAQEQALNDGAYLSEEQIDELLNRDLDQKALDCAFRFLVYRPRSEREVRQSLAKKGFPDTTIERAIDRLKELQLVDDAAFALFWVQNRETHSPRSRTALRFELRAKGIDQELIRDALEATTSPEESAIMAARKKAKAFKNLDYDEFQRKLTTYLARRGYEYSTIRQVTPIIWREMNDVGPIR